MNPKDLLDGHEKHTVILIKSLMHWAGDEATATSLAAGTDTSSARNARDRWASQLRSIEETRELQRKKSAETRHRLLEAMAKTMEGKKKDWSESAHQKSMQGSHQTSDVLNAKGLLKTRVAQVRDPTLERS